MTLDALDRESVAVGAAIGAGCHPCTQYHAGAALKAGLSALEVLGAIEEAQAVRAKGGAAVANVGRRILGSEQQEPAGEAPASSRSLILARLGAAAGSNSGALLAEYARQAAEVDIDGGQLRAALDIAEMVKAQAGRFLLRDAERALSQAVAAEGLPEAGAARCASQEATPAREVAAAPGCAPGCG